MNNKIKVLIVDDSALVRMLLQQGLASDKDIEICGVAPDPFVAREMIVLNRPDVITLDVEMPRMDGVEFLRRLMPAYPIPVIMVSSLSTKGSLIAMDALDFGAVDIVAKPEANLNRALRDMMQDLIFKVKAASKVDVSKWLGKDLREARGNPVASKALHVTTDKVIAIGASTGGTQALKTLLTAMPAGSPGIIIVQHMPTKFTRMFADRLNSECTLYIKEAEHGDQVAPGKVLIAPGGEKHMSIKRVGGFYQVILQDGPRVNGHSPSVDVLFNSVAQYAGKNACGVILTGMGCDGAKGLLKMRQAGAITLGQDEASSVVYGMPRTAHELGAVKNQLPLNNIAPKLISLYADKVLK
ncbi:MAG: chemotaxis response regulator protein-glutamate methylesterase [Lentisphaeraceae bacterium]|nr:chemotaxis response regulator protein-glutamate methylesterase [Lentisphaeraceae bacterium]